MTIIENVIDLGAAIINLLIRILYLIFVVIAWAFSLLAYIPAILAFAGIAVGMYFVISYGDVAVENVEFGMRCRVFPFYTESVRPILAGIIQPFFNELICWWNAFVWFPYGVIREVIFPTARDCGFVSSVSALADFIGTVLVDVFINYLATREFLQADLDFTNICATWQDFWVKWQALLCCGCNDLCPFFTKLPIFPSFFGSDQVRDDETWCFISNTFNGWMKFFQEIWKIVKEILYPQLGGLPRPVFRPAFDRWCAASTCFWRSWENAFQTMWDNFIPFDFVFKDFFCVFDVWTCIMLRSINLLIKMAVNYDQVLAHFTNQNSAFWIQIVKEDFKEIINLIGPTTFFAPITQVLPDMTTMEITSYQLLNTVQGKDNGDPNPIFGKPTVANCSCIFMTRLFCDPLNNGTTCAQQYNGTLLETFDFCCFGNEVTSLISNADSWMFEFTLHLQSADNFIVFLDRQPFSTFIKNGLAGALNCLYAVFLVVDLYGKCIQTVLNELTLFALCMAELFYRIFIAAVTLPYFETELPGIDNFLTRPGDEALNMAIGFLDRLVSTAPDSLLNCLCFLLNNGFPVPPAGCTMGCVVGGFVPPTMSKKSLPVMGLPEGKYRSRLNPIYAYTQQSMVREWSSNDWFEEITMKKTGNLAKDTYARIDYRLDQFSKKLGERKCAAQQHEQALRLTTTPPDPIVTCDPPPPCFDLCCLPKAGIVWFAQTTAFGFRAINAAFQTRNGTGSPYWDGTGCATGPCFQSDATAFIINSIAPLKCLCNFIHLVIPPTGFPDPCCFFTLLGEGLACVLQVVINIVTSLSGDPNYTYIKQPNGLLADFNIILDISLATFECACSFIRIVFGLVLSTSNLIKNFDPCCIPQKLFRALVETARLFGQTVLALGTLEEETSQCYLYIRSPQRPNCVPTLTDLPILVQFDRIRAVLLAPPNMMLMNECAAQVNPIFINQNEEGIGTCICTLLNGILAQVFKPDPNSTEPPGCPINICCPITNTSILIDQLLFFLARLIASFWQNWEIRTAFSSGGRPINELIPVEFIEFFFCDEYQGNPVGGPLGNRPPTDPVVNPEGLSTDKCGKFEPIFEALQSFLTGCLCSPAENGLGDILDNFLRWFLAFVSNTSGPNPFPIRIDWPRCICSGGPGGEGIIRPFTGFFISIARQIVILLRNLNNPSYWAPAGGSMSNPGFVNTLNNNLNDIDKTWVSRLLTPIAQSFCTLVTNLGCLLAMILGTTCSTQRYNVLSSITIYTLQAIIRIIAIIEAFAKLFAQELSGQCVGNPEDFVGTSGVGAGNSGTSAGPANVCAPNGVTTAVLATGTLNADSLGSIVVAILTFIADALIGIGKLSCSELCPLQIGEYTLNPGTSNPVQPESVACVCYNKTPYTAKLGFKCNFEGCQTFGAPEEVCPGGASDCSVDEACGVPPGTANSGNCPRFSQPIYYPFFFTNCNQGCRNMTDPVTPSAPTQNTWDQDPQTAFSPFVPVTHPLLPTVVVCQTSILLAPIAAEKFGMGVLAPNWQPICTRDDCVQRGFCKNDQMARCSPTDPRGVIDGIIITALRYLKCLLDILFNGLGSLIDPILIILSFLWQLSGGIIRFVVALSIFVIKIVVRPVIVNFFSLIPDTLTLLIWFFSIFTQPVILTAKTNGFNSTDYVNPLESAQRDKFTVIAMELFGTNLDGCIDNPIPCFCTHMKNLTNACNISIETITMSEMASYMGDHFEGITECDSLIHHEMDMNPTLWTDIPYAERYQYIDCVAKRVQGEQFNKQSSMWPKDFFYSQDGWYKLFANMKDRMVHHVTKVSRAEEELRKMDEAKRLDRIEFQKRLNERANLFDMKQTTEWGVAEDSPARIFLVNMDSFMHKYNMGYYHFIGRKAWKNMKRGDLPLGTVKSNMAEIQMAVNEIIGSFKYMGRSVKALTHHASKGMDRAGAFVYDVVYNKARNVNSLHGEITVPEPPILIKKAMDGTLLSDLMPSAGTNVIGSLIVAKNHIWRNLLKLDLRFHTLSWMKVHWTPLKMYNFETLRRMAHTVYHKLWPQHTSVDMYERFIVDGNCRVISDTVKLGSRLVDYCRMTQNLTNTTVAAKYETYQRYPTSKKRIRFVNPLDPPRHHFDKHVYRRAMTPPNSPPGSFNLYDWVLCAIEDIFNVDWQQNIDGTIQKINEWFLNPNIDPALYPDVGFRYWITFAFRCEFPENLNCSIGIGLEDAFINVTVVFIIIFIISALVFPSLISLVGFAGGLVLWFFIVIAVAWHYSPACLVLWPTYTVRPGLSIPLFPIPISTFTFPECLWDDTVGFLDRYITNDYTFLLNASLVNGPTAPMCDEKIDFINCKDVGVSDGLQNLLYYLYRWLGPGFCEVIIGLAGTTIGRLFPGLEEYMRQTLDRFKNANPTEMIQQEFCAKWTLPSIALIGVFAIPVVTFLIILIPALINILVALFWCFRASPLYEFIAEENEGDWVRVDGEDEFLPPESIGGEMVKETPVVVGNRAGFGWRLARWIRDNLVPNYEKVKLKKE